jgi:hypothetical protein
MIHYEQPSFNIYLAIWYDDPSTSFSFYPETIQAKISIYSCIPSQFCAKLQEIDLTGANVKKTFQKKSVKMHV